MPSSPSVLSLIPRRYTPLAAVGAEFARRGLIRRSPPVRPVAVAWRA